MEQPSDMLTLLVASWGESAGAVSIGMHLITNDGDTEGLFHGAFMQSGSPTPTGDVLGNQPYFDQLVIDTGCSGADDRLECLRGVSSETIQAAMNKSPDASSYQVSNHDIHCGNIFQAFNCASLHSQYGWLTYLWRMGQTAFSLTSRRGLL